MYTWGGGGKRIPPLVTSSTVTKPHNSNQKKVATGEIERAKRERGREHREREREREPRAAESGRERQRAAESGRERQRAAERQRARRADSR